MKIKEQRILKFALPRFLCFVLVIFVSHLSIETASADPILVGLSIRTRTTPPPTGEPYVYLPSGNQIVAPRDLTLSSGFIVNAEVHQVGELVTLSNTTIGCVASGCNGFLEIVWSFEGDGTGLHNFALGGGGSITGLGQISEIYLHAIGPNQYVDDVNITYDIFTGGPFDFGPLSANMQLSTLNNPIGHYDAYVRMIIGGMEAGSTISFGNGINVNVTPPAAAVPEPSTLTLLGLGFVGLMGYGWKRRKA